VHCVHHQTPGVMKRNGVRPRLQPASEELL
jgi:hypothetical protein